MQCVSAVEPEWLAELGPMFFSIKMAGTTRAEARRQQSEHKKEMESQMAQVEEIRRKRREDEEAKRSEKRDAERGAIVTPGMRPAGAKATPARTPRRHVGL
ncbi:unnamed protein product [Pedinophyceae sp. YPF-701]|nr:unnamed protein product [Pedinophyceae sp. YPF-701]